MRSLYCLLLIAWLGFSGCATYTDQVGALQAQWGRGDFDQAARTAEALANHHRAERDRVLLLLEKGLAQQAAGKIEASLETFEEAHQRIEAMDADPELSISAELRASVSNLAQLPYQARFYDRIMLHTYATLGELALGQPDRARVNLNRALEAQREALRENQRRLEKAREEAEGRKDEEDPALEVNEILEKPEVQATVASRFGHVSERAAYAPYVNPFAVWLDGIYFLHHGVDASDRERAIVSLRRVLELIGDHPDVAADLALAEAFASGDAMPPLTYVIFENGMAPLRQQTIIDFPTILFSTSVPYVGVALPDLSFRTGQRPHLVLRASNGKHQTRPLASMEGIIAREFEDQLPLTITRSLAVTGSRVLAQYLVAEGLKDQQTLRAVAAIGGFIYQAAVNQADLRTWSTLPREFQLLRIETPEDGRMVVEDPFIPGNNTIDLQPEGINVVLVRGTTINAPLSYQVFPLKP